MTPAQLEPFYITTAIDYVNAKPHIGHAYEKIATDVMARFQRLQGRPVFFLTGSDEHGTKVEKTAKAQGKDPKTYCDELVQEFQHAWFHLNLSHNRYIRTTDQDHYEFVAWIWKRMLAKGDIYKASYTGLYCTGCETFLTERDMTEEGTCKIHQTKPDSIEEENYFFKLSKYKEPLKQHFANHPEFVQPEFRLQEVLNILNDLEDISVSRSKRSVSWGIPVPDDADQVIYVWIDALSNYVTGIGYLTNPEQYKAFWPADYHVIGKDILRFHAIYWPAMLMSAELPLPKTIFAHGFINVNDAKMSKSTGNVISPFDLTERFQLTNPDPTRYFFMTTCPFGQDGNFSEEEFKLKVNADLANNLGNLLNRSISMTAKYFEGKVPEPTLIQQKKPLPEYLQNFVVAFPNSQFDLIAKSYNQFAFQQAVDMILARVDGANKLINESEPWNLFKNNEIEALQTVLFLVLETLRQVLIALSPIIPTLSQGIWQQLGYEEATFATQLWSAIQASSLPVGQQTIALGPLLPRLDSELVGAAGKKN